MRVFDITQRLQAATPVWPGDTTFAMERTWHAPPVNVARLTLSTHTGTHADAPLHYDETGADMAQVSLAPYLGECLLVDARGVAIIEPEHLPASPPPRVLFRTFDAFPHETWPSSWTTISAAAVEALADRGVILVGLDGPSLDPETSKTMDAHMAVRQRGMAILEGLVLDAPPAGAYELIALPLPIVGGDASPVRAVLRARA